MKLHHLLTLSLLIGTARTSATESGESVVGASEQPDVLAWDDAWQRVLANDPTLLAIDARIEAASGRVDQAARRPNPTVGVEVESILGTGPFRGTDAAEITLGLSQVIETANRLPKRTRLARSERQLTAWSREERVVALFGDLKRAFVGVLLAQRAVEVEQELVEIAEDVEIETERLVETAHVMEIDRMRARLARSDAAFQLNRVRRELEAAQARLAVQWGEIQPPEFRAAGDIRVEETLPEIDELIAALAQTPALVRFDLEKAVRTAELELAESEARPNVELFAGARYTNEGDGEGSFVAGFGVPWPVFDRNQGNIRSARARSRAVDHEHAAAQRELLSGIVAVHGRLAAAGEEVQAIESELLPTAREALAATEERYERGRYTLLNVLESRRTLLELQQRRLDALTRYAEAEAAIEALTRPARLGTD